VSVSPWPAEDTNSVIFILDASHSVEQQHLEDWLERDGTKRAFQGDARYVVVPISDSPERIPYAALLPVMDSPEDTPVVPVRVVWLKGLDVKSATPRLRDLLFGTPRHPGTFKARRILKRHPMRAKCISGAPATLGELRQRLQHRIDTMPATDQLAEFVAGQAGLALDIAERRLRGSRYKVPRRVASNLLSSREFVTALDKLSGETGRSIDDLQHEANEICKELIPVPKAFWLDMSYVLNRKLSTLGYDAEIVVDSDDLQRVRQIS